MTKFATNALNSDDLRKPRIGAMAFAALASLGLAGCHLTTPTLTEPSVSKVTQKDCEETKANDDDDCGIGIVPVAVGGAAAVAAKQAATTEMVAGGVMAEGGSAIGGASGQGMTSNLSGASGSGFAAVAAANAPGIMVLLGVGAIAAASGSN